LSAKRKAIATESPQTWEAANALLAEFGDKTAAVVILAARQDRAVARITARYAIRLKPLQDRLEAIVGGLEVWATAHRDEITDHGKTKTVRMAAGTLSWRTCPPSIEYKRGLKIETIIQNIMAHAKTLFDRKTTEDRANARLVREFVRLKPQVSKEAMLLQPDLAKQIDGVNVLSGIEEFIVDPTQAELAETK
jgi:phage host-nuclease inhibitor protein Gam